MVEYDPYIWHKVQKSEPYSGRYDMLVMNVKQCWLCSNVCKFAGKVDKGFCGVNFFFQTRGKNTADTAQKLYNMVLWLWFAEGLKGHWMNINEL